MKSGTLTVKVDQFACKLELAILLADTVLKVESSGPKVEPFK